MAAKRDAIDSFAKLFQFDYNFSPQAITKNQLLRSTLFLNSIPNEFSFSVSGQNSDNIFELFDNYQRFVYSSESLSTDLENSLLPFFCYLYITDYKNSGIPNFKGKMKINLISKLPEKLRNRAELFLNKTETNEQFKTILLTEKYIIKCSRSTMHSLNFFLNDPNNSQLRSIFTSLFILEETGIPALQNYTPIHFNEDDSRSRISILKAELPNSQMATFASCKNIIFHVYNDNSVHKIDFSQQQSTKLYVHKMPITTISSSSTSEVLFSADLGGTAKLWSSKALVTIPQSVMPVLSSDFAPKGGVFAFGSTDSIIRLFDTPNQKPIRYLYGHRNSVTDVKFHHNCFLISSCALDSAVRIWDPRETKTVRLWISKINSPSNPTFSWDGKLIAFLESPTTIVVGDLATSREIIRKTIKEVQSPIYSIHFALDNEFIYIISQKGEIFTFSLFKEQEQLRLIKKLDKHPISASFSHSGELYIATSNA